MKVYPSCCGVQNVNDRPETLSQSLLQSNTSKGGLRLVMEKVDSLVQKVLAAMLYSAISFLGWSF